ncbi:glyoxalase [Nocardiopsis sp. MG754419]|uniref:glyoxalase n=1 Tax=Nocardiopsis sp. MG754419 TaxID=2259865 RepID=UPI001BAB2FEA|nr:glyoxalase [Nocardiopsis sp. MG754419]MBR8742077.1 glyoxalase [Nocardiopsis sp. MG754419]
MAETVRANETPIVTLHTHDAEATLAFYTMLGFETTWKQLKPYVYLAFLWSAIELHYSRAPKGLDPTEENGGGALIMVDHVAPYHATFTAAMRAAHGKVLSRGLPRITRLRPGATRFSLLDPTGNHLIFIQRDEPEELEYGGSAELAGLAKVLDQVRIYREFKNDDHAAYRYAKSGLKRHPDAPAVERATAHAVLVELATALDRPEEAARRRDDLQSIMDDELTEEERQEVERELDHAEELREWRGDGPDDGGGERT